MNSTLTLSLGSLACILLLIGLRIPLGIAMGGVAVFGLSYLTNWTVALNVLGDALRDALDPRQRSAIESASRGG